MSVFPLLCLYSKHPKVDLARAAAQPSRSHGNSFCAQTKMAEGEKSAAVRATLTLVIVLLATAARFGGRSGGGDRTGPAR